MTSATFPLSTAQQVVWFHEQVHPGSSTYHFTAMLDLVGPLDEAALTGALAAVLDRHDTFRTAIVPGTDPARQRTAETVPLPLRRVDWAAPELSGPDWDALLDEQVNQPFDLSRPPLLRWTLVRVDAHRHRLLHTEHHLLHDGQSWTIVLRDLFGAYRALRDGRPIELPAAPSYAEYVAWQADPEVCRSREQAVAGWVDRLAGAPLGMTVPGTRRTAGRKRFAGAQHAQRLDPELIGRLRERTGTERRTLFTVLFALFGVLIRRYTGEPEPVIGTALANRPAQFGGTVGMFVNAVPVRLGAGPDSPVRAQVDDAMTALLDALSRADAPIQDITRAVGASAAGLDNPLFRLMFSAYDSGMPRMDLGELRVEITGGMNLAVSRMDIDVVVVTDDRTVIGGPVDRPAGVLLLWDYDTDRYDEPFIATMADRYARLLDAYARDPGTPADRLAMTAATEPDPVALGAGPAAVPPDAELFDRYVEVAAGRADAAALIAGPDAISHSALVAAVTGLADRLAAAGVRPGHRIAAVLPRSADAVLVLLACLRLRAVYCPLAPDQPEHRLRLLLRRLRPAVLICDEPRLASCRATGLPVATVGDARPPAADPTAPRDPQIAYVLHTSGSTGLPKAVAIGREALANHVDAVIRDFELHAGDRVLQFAQPSFDVALEEVLPTLLAGGTVLVARSELPTAADLVSLLTVRGATVLNLPTSYAAAILPDLRVALAGTSHPLRLLVLGGERVGAGLATELASVLGGVDVVNAYGVTEATITSSTYRWAAGRGEQPDGELPIGRPLAGVALYVLDRHRRPLPAGIIGELAIGGAGVGIGYLDDPAATADRFVPVEGVPGRCYLTGDLGYRRPDGQLCFLGRQDNQIKLSGHRIELEEIETAAAQVFDGAPRAVVLDTSTGTARLVGFVQSDSTVDNQAVTAALARLLPRPLLPSRWVAVPTLPTLAGGKPDRHALVAQAGAVAQPAPAEADLYHRIRAIWAEVLGRDDLSAGADFFDLGGHSLPAIQITSRLRELLGADIPLALVFDEPTLGGFAAAVGHAIDAPAGAGSRP